jgi:hypothetical protein
MSDENKEIEQINIIGKVVDIEHSKDGISIKLHDVLSNITETFVVDWVLKGSAKDKLDSSINKYILLAIDPDRDDSGFRRIMEMDAVSREMSELYSLQLRGIKAPRDHDDW